MGVKTLTYQRLIGNKWVGMSRGANNVEADMDALLSDGWTIVSDNITPGDGRTFDRGSSAIAASSRITRLDASSRGGGANGT